MYAGLRRESAENVEQGTDAVLAAFSARKVGRPQIPDGSGLVDSSLATLVEKKLGSMRGEGGAWRKAMKPSSTFRTR